MIEVIEKQVLSNKRNSGEQHPNLVYKGNVKFVEKFFSQDNHKNLSKKIFESLFVECNIDNQEFSFEIILKLFFHDNIHFKKLRQI